MKIKITIAFLVIGLGLSLIGGVISGNSFIGILTYSLISSSILAGLVFGLISFLEMKVPEFSEFLNQIQSGEFSEEDSGESDGGEVPLGDNNSPGTGESPMADITPSSKNENESKDNSPDPQRNEKPKNGKFGDHIIIDNIPIKNEPKLMAEAIRTIIAQDDMSQPQSPPKQK